MIREESEYISKEYIKLINERSYIKNELNKVISKIDEYKNNLLNKINNELKEFAIKNNSLFQKHNHHDYRYNINFNYKEDKIEVHPTSYSYSSFIEFSNREICEKAIERFDKDLKEYYYICK